MSKLREEIAQAVNDEATGGVPGAHRTFIPAINAPSRASRALVTATNGQIVIGSFTLTDVGIVPADNASQDDWARLEMVLHKLHRSFRWILADWLAFGDQHRWGDKYVDVAKWTGLKEKTLREYAYVAANVGLSIRMDKLSFAHHQLVAALPREQQEMWLKRALDGKWGTKRLRAEIDGTPEEKGEVDPFGVRRFNRRARALGRFIEYVASAESVDPKALEKARADLEAAERWIDEVRSWMDKQL